MNQFWGGQKWALLNSGIKMILRDFKTLVETLQCNVSTPRLIYLISNAQK
jgi:hypothetical protein